MTLGSSRYDQRSSGFSCGKMKIIAAIEDPIVIRKILEHMGLDTKPPRLMPARGPPLRDSHFTDDFFQQHFEDFQQFND